MPRTTMPIPRGPALLYVGTDGTVTQIDIEAVRDTRERRLCRALVGAAADLGRKADDRNGDDDEPFGFNLISETQRSGD